jgi:hypothetical protein
MGRLRAGPLKLKPLREADVEPLLMDLSISA